MSGHAGDVKSVAFSPDDKRSVIGSYDRTVRVWDASTGKELLKLEGHGASVDAGAFTPDGKRILTSSKDRTGRLWDAATRKGLCRMAMFTDGTWAVFDDAMRYDCASDGHIKQL